MNKSRILLILVLIVLSTFILIGCKDNSTYDYGKFGNDTYEYNTERTGSYDRNKKDKQKSQKQNSITVDFDKKKINAKPIPYKMS